VTEKAQRTIQIKWVRSGIGFAHRQKEMVRSLGLRRLNQVVRRPDTPQIRGLLARIPHLVAIVDEPSRPSAWAAVPEYTLRSPEVVPAPSPAPAEVLSGQEEGLVAQAATGVPEGERAAAEAAAESVEERSALAKAAGAKKPVKSRVKRKAAETKKGKAAAGKTTKSSKKSRK
jgi:large subunit ribosomal protein L30